jgi:tetratricopeptide (TPR) repeat protein
VRGFLSEGQRWPDRALAVTPAGPPPASTGARAAALGASGTLAYIVSDYERAAGLLQDSLALHRELDDRAGIAMSLHNLSRVRFYQGDQDMAVALCQESLALRRALGDTRGVAMSLNTLGVIARNRGDQAAARALYEESLGLFRELGDQWGTGLLLNNLARVARDLGDWAWTAELCAESLALFRDVGDRHGLGWVLSNLAVVCAIARSLGAGRAAGRGGGGPARDTRLLVPVPVARRARHVRGRAGRHPRPAR